MAGAFYFFLIKILPIPSDIARLRNWNHAIIFIVNDERTVYLDITNEVAYAKITTPHSHLAL